MSFVNPISLVGHKERSIKLIMSTFYKNIETNAGNASATQDNLRMRYAKIMVLGVFAFLGYHAINATPYPLRDLAHMFTVQFNQK